MDDKKVEKGRMMESVCSFCGADDGRPTVTALGVAICRSCARLAAGMGSDWVTAPAIHAEAVLSRIAQQGEDYEKAAVVWQERGLIHLADDAIVATNVVLAAARLLAAYRRATVMRTVRGMQVQAAEGEEP